MPTQTVTAHAKLPAWCGTPDFAVCATALMAEKAADFAATRQSVPAQGRTGRRVNDHLDGIETRRPRPT